jgi:hypothetical protein
MGLAEPGLIASACLSNTVAPTSVNLEIPNSIEKKSNLAKRRTHVEKVGLLIS